MFSSGSTQLAHPSQAIKNWRKQPTVKEPTNTPLESQLCEGGTYLREERRGGVKGVARGGDVEGVNGWRSNPKTLEHLAPEPEELSSQSQTGIFPKKVIKYILRPVMKTRKSSS